MFPFTLPDSATLRKFFDSIVAVFQVIAGLTPTPLDDAAVAALLRIGSNDTAWDIFYGLLQAICNRTAANEGLPEAVPVVEDTEVAARITQLEETGAVDIAVILALINTFWPMVQKILENIRNRRNPTPPTPTPNGGGQVV